MSTPEDGDEDILPQVICFSTSSGPGKVCAEKRFPLLAENQRVSMSDLLLDDRQISFLLLSTI